MPASRNLPWRIRTLHDAVRTTANAQGAVVIDNSSAWRMDPACPLVVPEVNPHDLAWHRGIIANPNCSTIQMVVALKPLHDRARITRVVVSTYQAASGAGKDGIDELIRQSRELLEQGTCSPPRIFQYQLAFNVIPPRGRRSDQPRVPDARADGGL